MRNFLCFPAVFLFTSLFGIIVGFADEIKEPEMVVIPAGDFLYGSSLQERQVYPPSYHEAAQETVYLATFSIGKYEVTNEEFECFIADNGYFLKQYWSDEGWQYREQLNWTQPRRWDDRDYRDAIRRRGYPVCAVSWFEAEAFCRWLAEKTGKPYRLPTEMEWEKAARGVDGRTFPWGDQWKPDICNSLGDIDGDLQPDDDVDEYMRTSPVNQYPQGVSPFGCFGMAGNVLEWCVDWIDDQAKYKVFRGGCFLSAEPRLLRCAWRGGTAPEIGHVYWGIIGFRVVIDE